MSAFPEGSGNASPEGDLEYSGREEFANSPDHRPSASDQDSQAVDQPVTSIQSLFGIFTTLLAASCLAFWVQIGRRWSQGKPGIPSRFRDARTHIGWTPVVLFFLWLAFQISDRMVTDISDYSAERVATGSLIVLGLSAVLLAVMGGALVLSSRSWLDLVKLGFRCDGLPGQFRDGGLGFIAQFLPVLAVMFAMTPLRTEETTHVMLRALQELGVSWEAVPIVATAVVAAPLFEELMFRVVLQGWLRSFLPAGWSIGLASLIFALVHGWADAPAIFVLALIMGTLYERRRSYVAVVTMHALFNAFNVTAALIALPEAVPVAPAGG